MRRHNLSTLLSVAFTLAILAFGIGCKNHLLSQPTFGGNQNGTQDNQQTAGSVVSFGAPANLQSTQGGYREITLTWNHVKDAARYNVYSAATEFDTFVQVGEASGDKASYTMKVPAGADFYYRVTAVNYGGEESPFSSIVRGTALATPLISSIEAVKDSEDSSITVYWYMSNADAYADQVQYKVFCIDGKNQLVGGSNEDGSLSPGEGKMEVTFTGLTPNSYYQYRVEAYHKDNDTKTESSPIVDAETARRLRPNAVESLSVAQGMSKESIELSFVLPEKVDVALPGGIYEQKPLYFKLYRREWKEAENNDDYQLIAEIGMNKTDGATDYTQVDFGNGPVEYVAGETVTYSDNRGLKRGTKYEYYLQSYAYLEERTITSEDSKTASSNPGWLIQDAEFKIGDFKSNYGKGEQSGKYVSATVGFDFQWDTMGMDTQYKFQLKEERWCLEGDNATNPGVSEKKDEHIAYFDTVQEVQAYTRDFELPYGNEEELKKSRGYYRYTLYILTPSQTDASNAEVELKAFGQLLVTDNPDLPKIQTFAVTSGLKNKVDLEWSYDKDSTYTLKFKEEGSDAEEQEIPHATLLPTTPTAGIAKYSHTGLEDGKSYVYTLYSKKDVSVSTQPITARTVKTPVARVTERGYDKIQIEWDDQIANEFIVTAHYTDSVLAAENELEGTSIKKATPYIISEDPHTWTLDKPAGYNNGAIAGNEITIKVAVSANEVKTTHTLDAGGSHYTEQVKVLKEAREEAVLKVRTLAPAATSYKGGSIGDDSLQLTWNAVEGAQAYAIIRSGLHISAESSGASLKYTFQNDAIYIVKDGEGTPTITLSGSNDSLDPAIVSVSTATAEGAAATYTLTDKVQKTPAETQNQKWAEGQSQIDWGAPYEYIVVPLASADDVPTYSYETARNKLTVSSMEFANITPVSLSTKGYCWNVQATKGSYASNDTMENDAILVTWVAPTKSDSYTVYRREKDGATWKNITDTAKGTEYMDKEVESGMIYEYLVASVGRNPTNDQQFLEHAQKLPSMDDPTQRALEGFILPLPQITSVSRDAALGTTKERVHWPAIAIGEERNKAIDGYIVEVMNNNIDAEWHEIARVEFASDVDKKYNYQLDVENKDDLLKVLRDYKHYFRIRAFVNGPDGVVYSKAPEYTWSDGHETEHVKWGARQITIDEFTRMSLIGMSTGMYKERGESGSQTDGNGISGLNSVTKFQWGPSDYKITMTYSNYLVSHIAKSGKDVTSLTVNGILMARGGLLGAYQTHYWTTSPISVSYTVDDDINLTGTIQFNGEDSKGATTVSRNAGTIDVVYNNEKKTYNMANNPGFTLPFAVTGGYLNDTEEWK
ncbi:MAG: fibronectin type III domain-containing protein [Spirochaetaceae bacterium]|nr:fibronectin type III domain-containing protein [Spirochaetaceae bacterium]